MSLTRFKSFVIVFLALSASILFFLIIDFFFGGQFSSSTKNLSENEKPYLQAKYGWYELKKNFVGMDQFGPLIYSVVTDEHGFRKAPGTLIHQKHNVIFLGDSFTYGVNGPWNETFVGMFASNTGAQVLNAGVSSYSPTPYLYQYRKALKEGVLSDQHTVIVGIDISDVQDEASYWFWDEGVEAHPRKMEINKTLRATTVDFLPLTALIYRYLRYDLMASNESRLSNLSDLPRSAFTWGEWSLLDKKTPLEVPAGYAPLGVEGGLKKVAQRLSTIVRLASENKSKVYFLIYPWPAQIKHADKFDWRGWVLSLCIKENCSGVVDTFPEFRGLATQNKNWLTDYYLFNDVHFNERGNQVISENLVKAVSLHQLP